MKKYVIGAVALGLMATGVAMPANASSDVVFNENCGVVTPAGETVSYTEAVPEVAAVYETQPNPDYVAAIPAVAAVEGNDCNRLFVKWATSWGSDKPEPNHDEAFITDQTLVNGETCGVWVQTDFYPYGNERERAKTDEILSDGVLNKGEDYNWSEDWAFVKAADCVVPVDPPVVPEEPVVPTPEPAERGKMLAETGAGDVWVPLAAGLGAMIAGWFLLRKRRDLKSHG